MSDEIELHWTLKVDYTFRKYDLFEALVNLCLAFYGDIPEEYDYAEFVIDWLKDNLINYTKDFLLILDSSLDMDCNLDGEMGYENITELLDNEEFMKEFEQYLYD